MIDRFNLAAVTRYIICTVLFLGFGTLSGQELDINRFYAMYKGHQSDFHISLGWPLIQMASWFIRDEPEKSLVKSARKVRVLVFEERPDHLKSNLKSLIKGLHKERYEEWMSVRESGGQIRILGREEGNFIRDFVILVDESDEFVLVSIKGKVDPGALYALLEKE